MYAVRTLYYAVSPDMRQRLKFAVAVACVYVVVSFTTALVAAGAIVFFLSNYDTLVYFGHDQARNFQAATPIASVVIMALAAAPSLHAMYNGGAAVSTRPNQSENMHAHRTSGDASSLAEAVMAVGKEAPSRPAWLVPAANGASCVAVAVDLDMANDGDSGEVPLLDE